jgi:hypothetical protein
VAGSRGAFENYSARNIDTDPPANLAIAHNDQPSLNTKIHRLAIMELRIDQVLLPRAYNLSSAVVRQLSEANFNFDSIVLSRTSVEIYRLNTNPSVTSMESSTEPKFEVPYASR